MKNRVLSLMLILTVLGGSLLAACKPEEQTSLRIAVIPVLDTLPLYVAEQQGYFAAENIEVELLPVKGAQERDTMIQAGEADGMLTDVPGVGIFDRDTAQVKIVSMARKSYPESPLFRLLAAPESDVNSPADLAGVEIGISQNTVIEYVTDRMLEQSGLSADQIAIIEVSAIPVRFEQLMANQIQAATLPDPMAQGAVAAGARLVVDDSQFTGYSQSVLVFTVEAIEGKPETIAKFLSAWDQAVADLNADPEAFGDLLIEQGRVPESIQGSYAMPPFPRGEITSEAQWADVVEWLLAKDLIDQEIPYQDVVDDSFLP